MAVEDVKLPDLGEDAGDVATVAFWYVEEGETVEEGDELLQMLTDKATFDVPSPVGGEVKELLAEEDQEIEVGGLLCRIETGD
jgi:pyruvate/2-oxoglutarate dehydrogenase complex dihydrolipoamide acyltransferase (E2) component